MIKSFLQKLFKKEKNVSLNEKGYLFFNDNRKYFKFEIPFLSDFDGEPDLFITFYFPKSKSILKNRLIIKEKHMILYKLSFAINRGAIFDYNFFTNIYPRAQIGDNVQLSFSSNSIENNSPYQSYFNFMITYIGKKINNGIRISVKELKVKDKDSCLFDIIK